MIVGSAAPIGCHEGLNPKAIQWAEIQRARSGTKEKTKIGLQIVDLSFDLGHERKRPSKLMDGLLKISAVQALLVNLFSHRSK